MTIPKFGRRRQCCALVCLSGALTIKYSSPRLASRAGTVSTLQFLSFAAGLSLSDLEGRSRSASRALRPALMAARRIESRNVDAKLRIVTHLFLRELWRDDDFLHKQGEWPFPLTPAPSGNILAAHPPDPRVWPEQSDWSQPLLPQELTWQQSLASSTWAP